MKKTILITLMAALMVASVSFAAMAKGRGQGQGQGQMMNTEFRGGGRGMGNFAELKLTVDQEKKILEIRQQFQKDTIDLRFEMQKKQLELRELWTAKPLNQSAIEAKTKEVTGLRVQMTNKAQTMFEKMKAVLTPEQQKKLDESGFNCNPGSRRKNGRGNGKGMMGMGF